MKKNIEGNEYFYVICLAAIIFLNIFLKSYGFSQPRYFTTDEIIYMNLGLQLSKDATNYSTERIYQRLGRIRSRHYDSYGPLFIHPPVYAYFISFSYRLFGQSPISAFSISLIFGTLTILVVFLIGVFLYGQRVGLLAAVFLAIDPIHWICSQKIWLETTLTFFISLAMLFFILGKYAQRYLILSGLSIGLALLTKYPGFLAILVIISYLIMYERKPSMYKQSGLLVATSFFVFSPWILLNYKLFGANLISRMIKLYPSLNHFIEKFWVYTLGIIMCFILGVLIRRILRSKIYTKFIRKKDIILNKKRFLIFSIAFIGIILLLGFSPLRQTIINMLNYRYIPTYGYTIGIFSKQPWYFYLKRLLELSGLYLFSYISFFLFLKSPKETRLLIMWSLVFMIFFILWRNYQSRYILPAVPALLLLSAHSIIWIYDRLNSVLFSYKKKIYKALFLILVSYFILKTLHIDIVLVLPNQMAYF